jgi:ferredoxin-nitrate reductase
LVCSCNNVGDGNILRKFHEGNFTLPSVCKATGAGTGCGSCRPEIEKILKNAESVHAITQTELQRII